MNHTARRSESSIDLTAGEREELEFWINSPSTHKNLASRATLILALADGLSFREIERRLGASAPTVSLWKKRFLDGRLRGLRGRHQGSQPRVAVPAARTRVIEAQKSLEKNGTQCSTRRLAKELGLHRSTVQRILSRVALPTRKIARLMADWYPTLDQDAAEIIGLYLRGHHHAAVFAVRDKINKRGRLSLRPGFNYHHHCEEALYAALHGHAHQGNSLSGQQRTPSRFNEFLFSVVLRTAWASRVHVILYNLEDEIEEVGRLTRLPHIWSYSFSRCTTWLEMVRFWFNKMERDTVEDGYVVPVSNFFQRLLARIRDDIKNVRDFRWITSATSLRGSWNTRRRPPENPGFTYDRIRRAEVLSIWDP